MQFDLFADGSAQSIPPWQDPARVGEVCSYLDTDRDHIGLQSIGRVGNNTAVRIVQVLATNGDSLLHEAYPARGAAAFDRVRQIMELIESNRQINLL